MVLSLAFFPIIQCLTSCAGCATVTETVEFLESNNDGKYLWNLTRPLCPGYNWVNASYIDNLCGCCGGVNRTLVANVSGWGESGDGTYCTHWHIENAFTRCSLPAMVNITGPVNGTAYQFNVTYCGLIISCMLWNLIQMIPLVYIIGLVSLIASAVIYGYKKGG